MKSLFIFFFLLFSGSAFADSYPWSLRAQINGIYYYTIQTASEAQCALYGKTLTSIDTSELNQYGDGQVAPNCQGHIARFPMNPYCPYGGSPSAGQCIDAPSCPAGQTRRSDGKCGVNCPAAGTPSSGLGANYWSIAGSSASACLSSTLSFGGCGMTCSGGSAGGGVVLCSSCKFTGTESAGSDAPASPLPPEEKQKPKTPEGCLSSGQGYFTSGNGTTTCIPHTDLPSDKPIETVTAPKNRRIEGPDGVTDEKVSDKEKCSVDGCVVEREKTVTGPDGVPRTTTEISDKSSFCEQNPNAKLCTGEDDPCKENPDRISCKNLGDAPSEGDISTQDKGPLNITPATTSAGSCPANVNMPKGLIFEWQPMCQFATGIKPVVLGIAWISAALIVFGFFRS